MSIDCIHASLDRRQVSREMKKRRCDSGERIEMRAEDVDRSNSNARQRRGAIV